MEFEENRAIRQNKIEPPQSGIPVVNKNPVEFERSVIRRKRIGLPQSGTPVDEAPILNQPRVDVQEALKHHTKRSIRIDRPGRGIHRSPEDLRRLATLKEERARNFRALNEMEDYSLVEAIDTDTYRYASDLEAVRDARAPRNPRQTLGDQESLIQFIDRVSTDAYKSESYVQVMAAAEVLKHTSQEQLGKNRVDLKDRQPTAVTLHQDRTAIDVVADSMISTMKDARSYLYTAAGTSGVIGGSAVFFGADPRNIVFAAGVAAALQGLQMAGNIILRLRNPAENK